jgi:hypothetical protein
MFSTSTYTPARRPDRFGSMTAPNSTNQETLQRSVTKRKQSLDDEP